MPDFDNEVRSSLQAAVNTFSSALSRISALEGALRDVSNHILTLKEGIPDKSWRVPYSGSKPVLYHSIADEARARIVRVLDVQ